MNNQDFLRRTHDTCYVEMLCKYLGEVLMHFFLGEVGNVGWKNIFCIIKTFYKLSLVTLYIKTFLTFWFGILNSMSSKKNPNQYLSLDYFYAKIIEFRLRFYNFIEFDNNLKINYELYYIITPIYYCSVWQYFVAVFPNQSYRYYI